MMTLKVWWGVRRPHEYRVEKNTHILMMISNALSVEEKKWSHFLLLSILRFFKNNRRWDKRKWMWFLQRRFDFRWSLSSFFSTNSSTQQHQQSTMNSFLRNVYLYWSAGVRKKWVNFFYNSNDKFCHLNNSRVLIQPSISLTLSHSSSHFTKGFW